VRMLLHEVLPAPGRAFDPAEVAGRDRLAAIYAAPDDIVRLNMIASLTGSAVGADGTSETLSSRVDRAVLGVIRAASDAVLVGASTVRVEGYVVPRHARLAVVTRTGDLSGHRLDEEAGRVLIVCPAHRADAVRAAAALPQADIVGVGGSDDAVGDGLAPAAILDALRGRGIRRVVCEGGPMLAGAFAAAGAIDEYCVTVAPILEPAAEPFLRLPAGVRPKTEPIGMLVDDAGFSYLRLRARRPTPAPSTTR
jgi:riboflavin biosynthesis pyrimidine reductase